MSCLEKSRTFGGTSPDLRERVGNPQRSPRSKVVRGTKAETFPEHDGHTRPHVALREQEVTPPAEQGERP